MLLLLLPTTVSPTAARPPNIVIIFTDDQGYADVGVFGAKDFSTPNLDRMARGGIRFTDFHVAQAVCSASRAALLTGCYPNRIGIHGALDHRAKHGISADEVTIAELLKARGYRTALFGKWHLGHHPQFLPTRHGFDEYFGLPYSNDMWPNHPEAKPGTYPALPLIEGDKSKGERVVQLMPDQTRLTEWYTERAVKFIERNKARPFFLYVPHTMPHVPLHASDRFKGKSKGGLYGDVIQEIDWSVGEILTAIKKHGLDRDTLVIFTSDNGPWLSYGGHAGSAGRLREGKQTIWEGGTRVPFIARWPGRIPAGRVNREPAMTIDLLPTIAKLAGAELPKHKIDGLDIWPLLAGRTGATSPHEAFFFYYNSNELQAVRSGKWKLTLPHTSRSFAGQQGRNDGLPVKYQTVKVGRELYDLENDVGETTNVADKHPRVVERLEALAERAREDMGDRLTERAGRGVRAPGRLTEANGAR
ncbi:MAG: sulfatase [Acidobacteriota bacterium]|nr:sulfatase [Acidobacteriota bacterium]